MNKNNRTNEKIGGRIIMIHEYYKVRKLLDASLRVEYRKQKKI